MKGVYRTDGILKVMKLYNQQQGKRGSCDEIRKRSQALMKQVCDKDGQYFQEQKVVEPKRGSSLKQSVKMASQEEAPGNNTSERARLSKKDEEVLRNLQEDLSTSNDLVLIDKPVETREFEETTNK